MGKAKQKEHTVQGLVQNQIQRWFLDDWYLVPGCFRAGEVLAGVGL
jgi:hypothetical protein